MIHPQVCPPEMWIDMLRSQYSHRIAGYGVRCDLARFLRDRGPFFWASRQPYDSEKAGMAPALMPWQ
jgi:hypothetical protein